ncbi:hypothetical protein HK096_006659 [Nowakowskiella sp. JEL0078]|nr:hypothetical protein HK096_006659 [Nowakowskiella sp. JEL0078]
MWHQNLFRLGAKAKPQKLLRFFSHAPPIPSPLAAYREKLLKKAEEKGVSLDTLLKDARDTLKNSSTVSDQLKQTTSVNSLKGNKETSKKSGKSFTGPSHIKVFITLPLVFDYLMKFKPLNEILKLETILKETPETIGNIWNTYHSTKNCISGSLSEDFYKKMLQRASKFPMVILKPFLFFFILIYS